MNRIVAGICLSVLVIAPASAVEVVIPLQHADAVDVEQLLTWPREDRPGGATGDASLPEGIDAVEALPGPNALRVVGSEAAIAQLHQLLALLDVEPPSVAIATGAIDISDPTALARILVTRRIARGTIPRLTVLTRLSDAEVAALVTAGGDLKEPLVVSPGGPPGGLIFETGRVEDGISPASSGMAVAGETALGGAARVRADLWTYDLRPLTDGRHGSLAMLLSIGDGDAAVLARISGDGQILSPIYVVSATPVAGN